jgi:integrase
MKTGQKATPRAKMKETFPDKVTLSAVLDARRAVAGGGYPIKYRVTHEQKQVYYHSGQTWSDLKRWDKIESTRDAEAVKLREKLKKGIAIFKKDIDELQDGDGFSFEALNNRRKKGRGNNVIDAMQFLIDSLIADGRIGSAEAYRTTRLNLKYFKGTDVAFRDITPDFLKDFEKWLRSTHTVKNDEGANVKIRAKTSTSVGIYMRALRAVLKTALKEGEISPSRYPFGEGKYQIPESSGNKRALTLDQIGKLMAEPIITQNELRSRDLWLFSYLCNGANLHDVLRLRFPITPDGDFKFTRKKTENTKKKNKDEIIVTQLPKMTEIISRWGNPFNPKGYVFPFLYEGVTPTDEKRIVKVTTRLINTHMIALGEKVGIGPVTTIMARHSMATILKYSGVSTEYIKESLGHSDLKTTENYLKAFPDKVRRENSELLTKYE